MLPRLSLAYLVVPAIPFLAGWVRPGVAVPAGLALLVGLALGGARSGGGPGPRERAVDVTLAIALVVGLALLSGAGAVAHQRADWYKHNAVLHDLSSGPWPVVYGTPDAAPARVLSYGLGYYLPAAAVGRVAGLGAAHAALLVWTVAGLGLTAAWLRRLTGLPAWLALAAWLAFSGMDALGVVVLGGRTQDVMQWWSGFAQYSSNPSLLFWAPQHALPGWLGAALVMHARRRRWPAAATACVVAAVVLWSPFAALGLVPLAAVALPWGRRRLAGAAVAAACAVPFAAVVSAYLVGVGRAGVPVGFVWQSLGPVRGPAMWAVFVAVEVGVPLAVLGWLYRTVPEGAAEEGSRIDGRWLWAAGGTLVLLPAAYVGNLNDLVMRSSIPALFVLAVLVLRLPWTDGLPRLAPTASRLLAAALLVGAIQPAADVAAQVMWSRGADRPPSPPRDLSVDDLPPPIAGQYLVPLEGPYARWLAPSIASPDG